MTLVTTAFLFSRTFFFSLPLFFRFFRRHSHPHTAPKSKPTPTIHHEYHHGVPLFPLAFSSRVCVSVALKTRLPSLQGELRRRRKAREIEGKEKNDNNKFLLARGNGTRGTVAPWHHLRITCPESLGTGELPVVSFLPTVAPARILPCFDEATPCPIPHRKEYVI